MITAEKMEYLGGVGEIVDLADYFNSNNSMLELKGISKKFGSLSVLENINLSIAGGEVLGILGTSGCGKSTLLNIMAGLLAADSGDYFIGGTESKTYGGFSKISYMFQEDRLLPWRTIRQNVAFGLEASAYKNYSKKEKKDKVDYMLELVGLRDFGDSWAYQLSGGMRSRAALARSLVVEPEILLLDEPFSKLDAQTRSQMHNELLRLQSLTDMTLVFVTHDVEEAAVLADRVAVLAPRPGRVKEIVNIALDKPRQLTSVELAEKVRELRLKI